jgi:hypothetical protein
VFHALEHAVVGHHDSGFSEWLGAASAVVLSNTYRLRQAHPQGLDFAEYIGSKPCSIFKSRSRSALAFYAELRISLALEDKSAWRGSHLASNIVTFSTQRIPRE